MFRNLLTLTLVATQLLSWSGGALYLCVGRDGSMQIDRSPVCGRCDKVDDDKPACSKCSCCQRSCCHHDQDENPADGFWMLKTAPRGCTHVLITQSNLPTVQTRTASVSVDELVTSIADFAIPAMIVVWKLDDAFLAPEDTLNPHSCRLLSEMLRSTVIRC